MILLITVEGGILVQRRIVDGMGTNRIWNFPFTPPLSEEMASLFRSQEKLYNEYKNT